MKNYTKTKTDRAWFSRLLEQETGNRAGLFLQPGARTGRLNGKMNNNRTKHDSPYSRAHSMAVLPLHRKADH